MQRLSFEKILTQSSTAYAMIAIDGKIIWRNDSFNILFVLDAAEALHVRDICPEQETVGAVMKAMLEGYCDNLKMDKRYKKKDGTVFWGRVSVSLAKDEDDLPIAYFISIEDITSIRNKNSMLKDNLQELQKFLRDKNT